MRPTPISGSQAKGYYYERDPIFAPKGGGENSSWHGKGAEQQNLEGRIRQEDFVNEIAGCLQDGTQVIKDGPNGEHLAGADITYDAPKSVSLMALHVGDARLVDAHLDAVRKSEEFVEREYSYVRLTRDGITSAVKVGNLTFANFTHSTNRENDPQLHTHGIIMNMVYTENGWRAHKNNTIFDDQKLIRSVYLSELAKNATDLGYRIEYGKNGEWEIAGVSKESIKAFSHRDTSIKAYWEEHKEDLKLKYPGASEAKLMDYARLESRPGKEFLEESVLKSRWESEISRELIREAVLTESSKTVSQERHTASEYVEFSRDAIHERESTFTRQKVIDGALRLSRGVFRVEDLEKAFNEQKYIGRIRYLGEKEVRNGKDGTSVSREVYSTDAMIKLENGIKDDFIQGKGNIKQLISRNDALKELSHYNDRLVKDVRLTTDQITAAAHILSSPDRFSIIQGDAGTGKTHSLKAVADILEGKDVVIRGLGFTGKSAGELEHASGIKSGTIHGFLAKQTIGKETEHTVGKEVWIVDESSMVGSGQMSKIVELAKAIDARVVFIGDAKQLQSIQAGKLFSDLQDKGLVEHVIMDRVVRQKTEHLQQALSHIKAYMVGRDVSGTDRALDILTETSMGVFSSGSRTGQSFDRVDPVREFSFKEELFASVVDDFVKKHGTKTMAVVTSFNAERKTINQGIHHSLKDTGGISSKEHSIKVKESVSFGDDYARMLAANYSEGQKVFISESVEGLKPGSEWMIAGTDPYLNKVTLENDHGVKVNIDLMKHGNKLSVFEENIKQFSEGDRIVFGKNNRKLRLHNGTTGTIEKLDDKSMMVRLDGSEKLVGIDFSKYAYIDHGYALTLHKAQGMSYDNVYYVADTKNSGVNSSQALYVAVSRAREDIKIYTTGIEKLKEQVKECQGKTSTLDFGLEKEKKLQSIELEK